MRFALGVDEDLSAFLRAFARDPLIGRSLRRRPWLRARAPTRAVRGARVGDLRAADRVRARGRDRAAHGGRAGTALGGWEGGHSRLRDLPRRPCSPAPRPRCCSPSTSPARARSPSCAPRARSRAGASICTAPSTSRDGGGCEPSPGIGPWTVEMLALHGQGRHDQLPAGDVGLLKLVGRMLGGGDPHARAEEWQVRAVLRPLRRVGWSRRGAHAGSRRRSQPRAERAAAGFGSARARTRAAFAPHNQRECWAGVRRAHGVLRPASRAAASRRAIGYPHSSSVIRSGNSSAHIPCASHAIGLTRTSIGSCAALPALQKLVYWLLGQRQLGAARSASHGPWRAWSANSDANTSTALNDQSARPIGMCTRATAGRQRGKRSSRCADPGMRDAPARFPRQRSAEHPNRAGRSTLAGALSSHPAGNSCGFAHRTRLLGEQQHDAGTERGAVGSEMFLGERNAVQSLAANPRAGVAAEQRGTNTSGDAAGGARAATLATRRARSRKRPDAQPGRIA